MSADAAESVGRGGAGEPTAGEGVGAAVRSILTAAGWGGRVEVGSVERLSGGASRETWAVDVSVDGAVRRLILQVERPGGVRTGGGMAAEATLVRAAADAGVAVPPVVAAGESAPAPLAGQFVITERLEGETIPRKLLRDDRFAAARSTLAADAGRAVAAVHRIPVAAAGPGLEELDQVEQFRDLLDLLGEPHPALELGLRWLDRHRPAPVPATVVHGDFRLGNLLVDDAGLVAVLDWELAHLGDPVEDLGWFCVRAWRFGSPLEAGGVGSVDELLDGYAAAAGWRPEGERVRWWQVMGTLKWAVMCMVQAATHLGGVSRSVELATIGRRTCENEWDLLELITPRSTWSVDVSGPASAAPPPSLHDRPTAGELVEAVREFLSGAVSDATSGSVRFHARVAANALAIVERELAAGAAPAIGHAAALATLGVGDDAALAAAIRRGGLDDRWDEVVEVVRAAVRAKVDVAHPGYAAGA